MTDKPDAERWMEAGRAHFRDVWKNEKHPTGRPVADVSGSISAFLRAAAADGFRLVRVPDRATGINCIGWMRGWNEHRAQALACAVEVGE